MNLDAPIPVAWPVTVLVVGVLCLGFYVLGGEHTKRDEDWRIRSVVQTNRHHATLFRLLFEHLAILQPEMVPEPKPEPRTPWWRRWWDRMEPTVEAEAVEKASEFTPEATVDENDEPEFTPDPNPDTSPIRMPEPTGPPTQPDMKQAAQVGPVPAMTDEEWAAYSERRLAEARAAIAEIGGGR